MIPLDLPAAAMSSLPTTTRSSAMDGDAVRATMTSTNAIWVRRGICEPCGKTFTILPDWLAPSGTTAFTAGSRPASGSPPVILPSKLHRTAKIQHACPIHPPCAGGLNGDCSACGAGSRPAVKAEHFLRTPTILAWDLGALCRILPIEARSP